MFESGIKLAIVINIIFGTILLATTGMSWTAVAVVCGIQLALAISLGIKGLYNDFQRAEMTSYLSKRIKNDRTHNGSESVCREDEWGNKFWFRDGQLHRIREPAIEWNNGAIEYRKDGKLHNFFGPSYVDEDGAKEWWIEGKKYTKDEFNSLLSDIERR